MEQQNEVPMAAPEKEQEVMADAPEAEAVTNPTDSFKQSISKLEAKNRELIGEKQAIKRKYEDSQLEYEDKLRLAEKTANDSWESKYTKLVGQMHEVTVASQAWDIASELSDSPEAVLPHIESRLKSEVNADGLFASYVTDKSGNKTNASYEELAAEIAAQPYLKGILKASFSNPGTTETVTKPTGIKAAVTQVFGLK